MSEGSRLEARKAVMKYLYEHPTATPEEVSEAVGLPKKRVMYLGSRYCFAWLINGNPADSPFLEMYPDEVMIQSGQMCLEFEGDECYGNRD